MYASVWAVWTFNINISNQFTHNVFLFLCFLQYPSPLFYDFQCTSFSPLWFSLFPVYSFNWYYQWNCFNFLIVVFLYTNNKLIFPCCFLSPETLLNLLFLLGSCVFVFYISCHLETVIILLHFQLGYLLFFVLPSCSGQDFPYSTEQMCKSGHSCLGSEEKLSVFTIKNDVSCRFSHMAFFVL